MSFETIPNSEIFQKRYNLCRSLIDTLHALRFEWPKLDTPEAIIVMAHEICYNREGGAQESTSFVHKPRVRAKAPRVEASPQPKKRTKSSQAYNVPKKKAPEVPVNTLQIDDVLQYIHKVGRAKVGDIENYLLSRGVVIPRKKLYAMLCTQIYKGSLTRVAQGVYGSTTSNGVTNTPIEGQGSPV